MAAYDAFISYSHAKDKPIATALQSAVQKLGKPWYRRRALRIFRDDTSLSATPGLWPAIEQALGRSRFLLLLASPEAAASPWVDKEVAYWLKHKSAGTVLIALTDGDLTWDASANDFAWNGATPLPPALKDAFESEPKWVDLRAYRDGANPRDARFAELAADFAAAIHGLPKEDLLSQELRQQRRTLNLAWSAAATLLVLAGAAARQWSIAAEQRNRAERTLTAATEAANTLIFDLAEEFRDREGMPIDLTRKILDRAQSLQQKLTSSGETTPELQHSEIIALLSLADTLTAQGDLAKALELAEKARTKAAALAESLLGEAQFQALLSSAYRAIGQALLPAGRREEALEWVRKSAELDKVLIAKEPENAKLQRSLASSYDFMGYVLLVSGKGDEALKAYREALAITEKLAAAAPDDAMAQSDIATVQNKVGDVMIALGEPAKALETYLKSLAISEAAAAKAPDNTNLQNQGGFCNMSVGDALMRLGRAKEALDHYQKSLAIRSKLAAQNEGNAARQRELVATCERVGNAHFSTGHAAEAYKGYVNSLTIIEKVAAADPANVQRQRERGVAYEKVGDVLLAAGHNDEALKAYRESLKVREKLAAEDANNTEWQRDVAFTREKTAAALLALKQNDEAIAPYRKAIDTRKALVAKDAKNVDWGAELATSYVYLGNALADAGHAGAAVEAYTNGLTAVEAGGTSGSKALLMEVEAVARERLADTLLKDGKKDEAIAAYKEVVHLRDILLIADPRQTDWRKSLLVTLIKLGDAGDDAKARYSRALTIVRALDAGGLLTEDQKAWVGLVEERLAKLTPDQAVNQAAPAQ